MEEEWKIIKDYPMYEISSLGRVRSSYNGKYGKRTIPKIMSNKIDKIGYSFIHLKNDSGRRPLRIHRLVAEAFIPNINNLPEVNHIDENKQNNTVSNLEWCDRHHNMHHSQTWKKTERAVNQYDSDHKLIKTWSSMSEASRAYGVSVSSIFTAIKHSWKSTGFYWKYVNN